MFKVVLLITTLLVFGNALLSQAASSTLSGNSGYVYGPPQGANFNYDVTKNYGQHTNVVSAWPNKLQYPRINTLNNGHAYNAGISTVSALGAPYAYGYQWAQGYPTSGYYNTGYYNNAYNMRPNPNYNYGGWQYNRPYHPSIQYQN